MTDRHALPRAAGSIRLIGVKKNHRLSRWVAFYISYRECALKSAADCVEIQAGGMSNTV